MPNRTALQNPPATASKRSADTTDSTARGSTKRLLFAALAVLVVAAAVVVRVRAGDRDAELRSLTTAELAALAHLQPDDAQVHLVLARKLAAERRLAAARAEYAATVRLDPRSAPAHVGLGETLAALGDARTAEAELADAISLDGTSFDAQLALGRLLSAQGRAKDGLAHLQRAVALNARSDAAEGALGTCYVALKHDPEAMDCFRRAIALRDNIAQYHTELAAALARHGDVAEALREFERALALAPQDGETCAQAGEFLATNPPDAAAMAQAEELLTRATRLPTRMPSEVWFDLGQLYLQTGRAKAGAVALERAIAADPRDERFYYALANAYRRDGSPAKAAAVEQRFARISALHSRMYHLAAVVNEHPNDTVSRLALARAYRDLGLPGQASLQYSLYLRRVPEDVAARAELDAIVRAAQARSPATAGARASAAPPVGSQAAQ